MVKNVLLFGDIGGDMIAQFYGFLKDEVNIAGVFADYGNVSRENAVTTVKCLSNLFDFTSKQVKIICGAELDWKNSNVFFRNSWGVRIWSDYTASRY